LKKINEKINEKNRKIRKVEKKKVILKKKREVGKNHCGLLL
jgi:hypothetical protein